MLERESSGSGESEEMSDDVESDLSRLRRERLVDGFDDFGGKTCMIFAEYLSPCTSTKTPATTVKL
jgi:hypothetical protein